jgi:transcriptional regulator with XRE-family HTH domain
MNYSFGVRRKALGLKLSYVAARCGTSEPTIFRIEKGVCTSEFLTKRLDYVLTDETDKFIAELINLGRSKESAEIIFDEALEVAYWKEKIGRV